MLRFHTFTKAGSNITRREALFLAWHLALSGGATLLLGGSTIDAKTKNDALKKSREDPTFHVEFDSDPRLSFEEMAQFARWTHEVLGQLRVPHVELTRDSIQRWAAEIAPMYEYNGLTAIDQDAFGLFITNFESGDDHNHLLGVSDCKRVVELNERYASPASAWNGSPEWLGALVHELAHVVQGPAICSDPHLSSWVEPDAQIMALEVEASLAIRVTDSGPTEVNSIMLYIILSELQEWAVRAAYATIFPQLHNAEHDNNIEEAQRLRTMFSELHDSIYPSKFLSRIEALIDRFSDKPLTLLQIVTDYALVPMRKVMQARLSNFEIQEPAIPVKRPSFYGSYGTYPATEVPLPPFKLNDLAYVLQNAGELARELLGEKIGASRFVPKYV